MPLVSESLPPEPVAVLATGTFANGRVLYYLDGVWYVPQEGADAPFDEGQVLAWEPL